MGAWGNLLGEEILQPFNGGKRQFEGSGEDEKTPQNSF